MKATRLTGIPIAHVTAEVTAFPLASTAALELACDRLNPKLDPADSACKLWRAAEQAIFSSLPGFSIDEAVAIRDKIWFGDHSGGRAGESVPLHRYLRRIATENLEPLGVVATPRLHPDELRTAAESRQSREALARWRWRWLSLALPPDLLLAATPVGSGPVPLRVDCVSSLVERQLADGKFAETHLHLGAALDFPLLWVLMLHAIADSSLRPSQFESPGAIFGEGRELGPWLIRAATLRYILAAYLASVRRFDSYKDSDHYFFQHFLADQVQERLLRFTGAASFSLLLQGINDIGAGVLNSQSQTNFVWWQRLYRQLTGLRPSPFPENRIDALEIDPIIGLLPTAYPHLETAETRFIVAALAYLERLEQQSKTDTLFARLFWQVVRIRNLIYRHVTQRPMTPGLQWFIRFYSRIRLARRLSSYRLRMATARTLCGGGQGLLSLEVRTSPERSISAVYKELNEMGQVAWEWQGEGQRQPTVATTGGPARQAAWQWREQQPRSSLMGLPAQPPAQAGPEFGVIYHFSKDRGGGALEGRPQAHWINSNADPQSKCNPTGYRYAGYFQEKQREALTLIWLLHNLPATVELIRGVDVCTDEMGVPFWVLAPILRAVRRAGDEAVRALEIRLGIETPSLRATVHAGEDFVHLLTGLRHIDEAIHLFELREGDRLGHAMALGVDARDWAIRAGRIAIPREIRLFDLAWEWNYYRRSGAPAPKRRRTLLESEIARLSEIIFGKRCDYHELMQLTDDLQAGFKLWQIGFPNGPIPEFATSADAPKRIRLFLKYLTHPYAFQQGRVIEWVDPENEGDVLNEIQTGIRCNINARGFTIEVNPSSNLLIGDLGDLARHPLWRLNPPLGGGDGPPLSLCIGSDDPLTFGTSLPYEYQLVYDALVLAGVPGENARAWLNNARGRGLEARFTRPFRYTSDIRALYQTAPPNPPLILLR